MQQLIDKTLTSQMEQWRRSRFTTHWNRPFNRILSELLEGCEESYVKYIQQGDSKQLQHGLLASTSAPGATMAPAQAGLYPEETHLTAMAKWLNAYPNVEGYPVNVPYTNPDGVCKEIFRTGIHLREEREIDYSCAVRVIPYPCDVFSVWVYIAVLQK